MKVIYFFYHGRIRQKITLTKQTHQKLPTKQTNPKSPEPTKQIQVVQVSIVLCGWNFSQHNNHHKEGENVDDRGQKFLDGF